ncbi:MAG: hypothetical protein HW402_1586 [Dehalococcoidales bacterium]|nr:hypothetical protein [Dehalococcoidales bacterium]
MRQPAKYKVNSLRRQRGFSLLETVLAVFLIALIGAGVIRAISTNARASGVLDEKVQATNLATAYLEGIRQLGYDDSASPYASVNATVTKPPQYIVATNIAYGSSTDGLNITWYDTPAADRKLQKITISVSRTSGKLILTTCTFRTTRTEQ